MLWMGVVVKMVEENGKVFCDSAGLPKVL